MTEKGYQFLKETVAKYKSLFIMVVVGNDKSLQKDYELEIINFCIAEKINYTKKSDFKEVQSEYAIAISWRWLINHPPEKLIVFHDSPLPRYRGFSPLVNALINKEKEIGVTAIFGADDFDTGDIIAQSKSRITYPITIASAIKIINNNYLSCAELVLNKLLLGDKIEAIKQVESEATYSVWRDENDYKIDWSKSSVQIRRLIDAVGFPYKGASTSSEGILIRILSAEEYTDVTIENRDCGKVLFVSNGTPVVICGKGLLKITEAYVEVNGKLTSFLPVSKFRIRFI
ncbi:MAG: methionyl-tRNA formyltransferase [Candidatus Dependentiae bacterium]|nr:methionyl-tRNA formyltransferase [Candidatus Dependentiae bacterium]